MTEQPTWYRDEMAERSMYRAYFREHLSERLGNRFWKSPDIKLATDVFLEPQNPHQYVPILFPGNIELLDRLPVDVITYLGASTKSRYAQLGLEVKSAGQLIAESLKDQDYVVSEQDQLAWISVMKWGNGTLDLKAGTSIMRLFSSDYLCKEPLRAFGDRLTRMIDKGDLMIEGEKGIDWDIAYYRNQDGTDQNLAAGITLALNQKRKWIKKSFAQAPLWMPDLSGFNFRNQVDQYLEDAPITSEAIPWIGETTAKVRLAPHINGLIQYHVSTGASLTTLQDEMFHLASPLVDGGFDDTIRAEIVGRTDENAANRIFMTFFQDVG